MEIVKDIIDGYRGFVYNPNILQIGQVIYSIMIFKDLKIIKELFLGTIDRVRA